MPEPPVSADERQTTAASYLRFFGILLFIALSISVGLPMLGCNTACNENTSDTTSSGFVIRKTAMQPPGGAFVQVLNPAPYLPGDTVKTKLGYNAPVQQFTWNPPKGVSEVRFKNAQPEPGGPPYIFKNLDEAAAQQGIEVEYEAPAEGYADGSFRDSTEMVLSGDIKYVAEGVHAFERGKAAAAAPPQAPQPIPDTAPWLQAGPADPVPVPMWQQMRFIDTREITMTTELCQDYLRSGQSTNQFLAWRVPVSTTIAAGQAYVLPLVSTPTISPTLSIYWFGASEFTMPLEPRWDAMQWAEEHLPARPGEMWLALGVDRSQDLTCPEGLVIPANRWSLLLNLTLDLSRLPGAGAGRDLASFACYKTGTSPALLAALAAAGGRPGQARLYGDGVACLGPDETALVEGPGWYVTTYTLLTPVTATHPITVRYWVENHTQMTQTLTLAHTSDLAGAAWRAYPSQPGNLDAPDLTAPLGAQITAAPGGRGVAGNNVWLLADAPASASGAYTVALALANPALNPPSSKKVASIWVGPWDDPAPLAPAVTISKSAAPDPVAPGGWLTYTLQVTNIGPLPLHDLVISDTVPISTTFHDCRGADQCAHAGGSVRWDLATLGAGMARSVMLVVRVAEDAPPGGKLRNSGYSITTREEASAQGAAVETGISPPGRTIYLPALIKMRGES